MHTSPSAQATWGTNKMLPTPNREAFNYRRSRLGQTEDNEVCQPEFARLQRSPNPSVSPTRARFPAMGHFAEGGLGEEPFNYADLHPTFGMGQNLRKNDVPKVIPRLRLSSRSNSFRSKGVIGGLQTFKGSQYPCSTTVDRRPRATSLDSSDVPYNIGPAVDQVGSFNNNERTRDLDAFWRKFKYWEENYTELPDRVFYYISDIDFHESHFNSSFFFLRTMIARYAATYSYEVRVMDLPNFNLEDFEKKNPSLTRLIEKIVDCCGDLNHFFKEGDGRVHLVQAIIAQNIVDHIFYVPLFGATPEEEQQLDALYGSRNRRLHIKMTRTILNGAPAPRNFLPAVVKLSKNLHYLLAPLRTLTSKSNPHNASATALEESQDQLKAIVLCAAKLAVDMHLQNARFTFQWATAFAPVRPNDPTVEIANEYVLASADYTLQPRYPRRPALIFELALFPSATSIDARGAQTMHCPKLISVCHDAEPSLLARPHTTIADLIAEECKSWEYFSSPDDQPAPSSANDAAPWKHVFQPFYIWETVVLSRWLKLRESHGFGEARAIALCGLLAYIESQNESCVTILRLLICWVLLEVNLRPDYVGNGIAGGNLGLFIWFLVVILLWMDVVKLEGWGKMMEGKKSWY